MQSILLLTAFVTTLLHNTSVELWVGLTSDSKGHFQWAQPGLLSYTNWAPGEPLDNSGPHHNKTPVLTTLTTPSALCCPRSLSFSDDFIVTSQGNCVVMIHGNPQKNTGMWASRACEMESNGFICQREQGVLLFDNNHSHVCYKHAGYLCHKHISFAESPLLFLQTQVFLQHQT